MSARTEPAGNLHCSYRRYSPQLLGIERGAVHEARLNAKTGAQSHRDKGVGPYYPMALLAPCACGWESASARLVDLIEIFVLRQKRCERLFREAETVRIVVDQVGHLRAVGGDRAALHVDFVGDM